MANANIHKGTVGGIVRGIKKPVTKKPSLISCFLNTANRPSHIPPATNTVKYIGKTLYAPKIKQSRKFLFKISGDCKPTLYIPKIKEGSNAKTTMIIVLFKSIESLM